MLDTSKQVAKFIVVKALTDKTQYLNTHYIVGFASMGDKTRIDMYNDKDFFAKITIEQILAAMNVAR